MKKVLRYCGFALIGLLTPIIIVMTGVYYFDIKMIDFVTTTENVLSAIIRAWDLQESTETQNNQMDKAISNSHQSKKMAHLYYSDETEQFLKAEDRVLSHPKSPCQYARLLLKALFNGPNSNLNAILPKGDFLRAVYIDYNSHTAYVDLKQTIITHLPGGVTQEILSIYSIVNTLTLNIREIERVKFVIGGQEANTLTGHLDIRYPFTTNMLMIR